MEYLNLSYILSDECLDEMRRLYMKNDLQVEDVSELSKKETRIMEETVIIRRYNAAMNSIREFLGENLKGDDGGLTLDKNNETLTAEWNRRTPPTRKTTGSSSAPLSCKAPKRTIISWAWAGTGSPARC